MKRTKKISSLIMILILAIVGVSCKSNIMGEDYKESEVNALQTNYNSGTTEALDTDNTSGAQCPRKIQTDLKPMKDVYVDDFLIGTAISTKELSGERYELLKKHFNVVTVESEMMPNALAQYKGQFDFSDTDSIVDNMLGMGVQMVGHTLICEENTPSWMYSDSKGNPLEREDALDNMKTYITTVMEHFSNKVIAWDVVNDAMSAHPRIPENWKTSLHPCPWRFAVGSDYVEQAFLAAREVLDAHPDWDIKLYYNDNGLDNQDKALAVYNMVKEINDNYQLTHPDKLLIEGIGMECHFILDTDYNKVKSSLEKFISLGVEISINELDIRAISQGKYMWETGMTQAYKYYDLFYLFKAYASDIKRITFWGMDDDSSWMTASSVMLFNKKLQARPAYYGVTQQVGVLSSW